LRAQEFWFAPSDNVEGRYPKDEYAPGGMVLHTKRVFKAAQILMGAFDIGEKDRDFVLAACLLHDLTKAMYFSGESQELFFDPMHAYTVGAFVQAVKMDDTLFSDESNSNILYLVDEDVEKILRLIRVHMGHFSPVPETLPILENELLMHIADLMAKNLHEILDVDVKPSLDNEG